jgi:flagellar motor switch protein FliN
MTRSYFQEVAAALAEGLGTVVGALIDAPARVTPGAPLGGAHWNAEVVVGGTASGSCTIAFDAASASAVTAAIMGLTGPVPPEAVIDTFSEVCSQALGALSLEPSAKGASLKLGTMKASEELEPGAAWTVYAISADSLAEPLTVTIWGTLQVASGAAVLKPQAAASAAGPSVPSVPSDRIDVILDIDLPLTVRFGRTEMPLKALTRIGPGSVIDLGRSADDPVEILVSNRVVARGEVVIVGGNYGVRILDVISPRDRPMSLEE